MISHWTSPEGLKAIEKTGPVEWRERHPITGHYRKVHLAICLCAAGSPYRIFGADGWPWEGYSSVSAPVALAILQKHAREWLAGQRPEMYVARFCGHWYVFTTGLSLDHDGRPSILARCSDGWGHGPVLKFTDYDGALVRAIAATEENQP